MNNPDMTKKHGADMGSFFFNKPTPIFWFGDILKVGKEYREVIGMKWDSSALDGSSEWYYKLYHEFYGQWYTEKSLQIYNSEPVFGRKPF
ncbi:MAG: hypothetical protein F6K31_20140 [Symploca sp. SIO2G7]|nr:hypothetical protein [Symploca sp. SIO2G7]